MRARGASSFTVWYAATLLWWCGGRGVGSAHAQPHGSARTGEPRPVPRADHPVRACPPATPPSLRPASPKAGNRRPSPPVPCRNARARASRRTWLARVARVRGSWPGIPRPRKRAWRPKGYRCARRPFRIRPARRRGAGGATSRAAPDVRLRRSAIPHGRLQTTAVLRGNPDGDADARAPDLHGARARGIPFRTPSSGLDDQWSCP